MQEMKTEKDYLGRRCEPAGEEGKDMILGDMNKG